MEHGSTAGAPFPGPGVVEITSKEEFAELFGTPHPLVLDKVTSALGDFERQWLGHSPLCLISTSGTDGTCDVSPRGDPPGFALVLDDHTLAIPDRPGNRRADSWHNVLENPHVGLIFLVPGLSETLRVNGPARIVREAPFFDQMSVKGQRPRAALIVRTQEVYFHCSRSLTQSGVWRPESWAPDALPPRPPITPRARPAERSAAPAAMAAAAEQG